MTGRLIWPGIAALLLTGCGTTPAPSVALRPVPTAWTHADGPAADQVEDRWWLAFADPLLTALVETVDDVDDVAIARARLEAALARLGASRAALRPSVGAEFAASRQRIDDLEQDQLQEALRLAFSPDINGAATARRRSAAAASEAEAARLDATRQATRAAAVRLYIAWQEATQRAEAADRSVGSLAQSLALARTREAAGLTSGLDPVAVEAQLAAARARAIAARQAADTARLGLEALLGEAPGALEGRLTRTASVMSPTKPAQMLAPVAVLSRRPDIRAAQAQAEAAGALSEAARRDYWPTLSLAAALGLNEADPATPLTASGALFSLAAGVAAPVLTFGRLDAARQSADAGTLEAELTLRKAATGALAEVEQAVVTTQGAIERQAWLARSVAAGRDRVSLSSSRYRAGLSPLIEVLVAEDALALAETELATADADHARAHVALSVAMGLGAQ